MIKLKSIIQLCDSLLIQFDLATEHLNKRVITINLMLFSKDLTHTISLLFKFAIFLIFFHYIKIYLTISTTTITISSHFFMRIVLPDMTLTIFLIFIYGFVIYSSFLLNHICKTTHNHFFLPSIKNFHKLTAMLHS